MATGATEFIDATTAAVFIPVIWSREAIIAREANLNFAARVNRIFEKELSYGSSIHVPSVGNLAVVAKNTSSNAATTFQTITETNTDLTVGTWEYQAIAIETFTKVQSMQDLMARYAPKQGYALGLAVDNALSLLVASFSNNTVGTLAQELQYEDALRAVQYLNDANAPVQDRTWYISPAQLTGFMKLDQFVNSDYNSLNTELTQGQKDAFVGNWMKVPIFMSTATNGSNSAGHNNALIHKECIALAMQLEPLTHTFFDVNYLANKAVVEQIRGQATMRDDHGVNAQGA